MRQFDRLLPVSVRAPDIVGPAAEPVNMGDLLDGRRVGVVGFQEFRSSAFLELTTHGLATFDLAYDVQAFRESLPRIRIIVIRDFDPADFL